MTLGPLLAHFGFLGVECSETSNIHELDDSELWIFILTMKCMLPLE